MNVRSVDVVCPGKPIGEMMASWTEQMGYPILKIVKADLSSGTATLTVEQSWFLVEGTLVRHRILT